MAPPITIEQGAKADLLPTINEPLQTVNLYKDRLSECYCLCKDSGSKWVESFVSDPHDSARKHHPLSPFFFSCYLNNLSAHDQYIKLCHIANSSATRLFSFAKCASNSDFSRSNRTTNITKLSAL